MSRVALIVDDSMLIRHTVRRFLEDRGYTVETASNGVEGLTVLQRVTPNIIVTDLLMPKMTGAEFIREVRHRSVAAKVPIIVVAGRRGSTAPSLPAGADFVVYKDIDLVEQLQVTLDKFGPVKARPPARKKGEVAAG